MSRKLSSPQQCPNCKNTGQWFTGKICHNCYRNYKWKRKLFTCKRCKRQMPHHSKSLCNGCYNYVFHLEKVKIYQNKRLYNIDDKTYKKATKVCVICGFDKVVDLHHIDHDHKNNSEENLIGLCPNHHKMLHNFKFRDEVLNKLNKILRGRREQTTLPITQEAEAQENKYVEILN